MRQQISIVHAMPGRVRMRLTPLHDEVDELRRAGEKFLSVSGVLRVRANARAASLVVEFDQTLLLEDLIGRLAAAYPRLSEWGSLKVHDLLAAGRSNPVPLPQRLTVDPARRIVRLLSEADTATADCMPGHVGLKVLIPAGFLTWGLYKVLTARHAATPHWMNLFMFGFTTFVAMNSRALSDQEDRPAPAGSQPITSLPIADSDRR